MLGQYLLLLLAVTTVNCCAPNSPRRTPPPPAATTPMPCGQFSQILENAYNTQFGMGFDLTTDATEDNSMITCPPSHPTLYYVNGANPITQATAIQCTGGQWMATNAVGGGAPVVVANPIVRCAPMLNA